MKFLQDNGYHVITFSDLADYFEQGRELPNLPVIISFDDGWETQYENALPVSAVSFPRDVFCGDRLHGPPRFHFMAPIADPDHRGDENRQPLAVAPAAD